MVLLQKTNCEQAIRWGRGDWLFELCGPDEVIARAEAVFGPWVSNSTATAGFQWQVRRSGDPQSGEYALREVGPDRSDEAEFRGSCDRVLTQVEYSAIVKCFDNSQYLCLHGALLSKNGQGVVIVGPCESGKSTLSCALWRHGWSFLCDDATMIDGSEGWAYPTPRRVSLRPTSRDLLGDELWRQILMAPSCARTSKSFVFHPSDIDDQPPLTKAKVVAVVFLKRRGVEIGEAELRRVNMATTLLSLLPYANYARHLEMGAALQRLQPVAASVPAFDLGRGDLSAMVDRMEALISS